MKIFHHIVDRNITDRIGLDDCHGGTVVQTVTMTLTGAQDAGSKAKVMNAHQESKSFDGMLVEHGRYADKHDSGDDPMPQPAAVEFTTLLGTHLHFGEHWF